MGDLPVVSIIGRPNVGKSTLFNRIVGERIAIIERTKGVTRDRVYRDVEWDGVPFRVVDTGGIITSLTDVDKLYSEVREQSLKAIEESDVVIFLTDVKEGLHPLDEEIAELLRKGERYVILAVNKVDNEKLKQDIGEFEKLGIKDLIPISALHGLGVDILLDKVVSWLRTQGILRREEEEGDYIKVAIIGRPNVGKSSFLNALLNEKRVVVDDKPGTTRDAIDTYFKLGEKKFIIIDTAGIRHKSKIKTAIEYFSSVRTREAIDRSHVVLFMIDGWEGIRRDDLHYIYKIWEKGKGVVLVINKRDLIQRPIPEYEKLIKERLALSEYLPVIYTSAKEGYNIKEAILCAYEVYKNLGMRVKTSKLNELLEEAKERQPKVTRGRRSLKIYYGAQTGIYPPTFHFVVNYPELVNKNFMNFLERRIRLKFGFMGAPIKLLFRERR